MRRVFLSALMALMLAACAAPREHGTFSGTLSWSFEESSFRTDDGRGPWWLAAEPSIWPQVTAPLTANGGGPWGRVHLTVEGTLSAPGRYGHMGAYERELRVTRVQSATVSAASPPPSNN